MSTSEEVQNDLIPLATAAKVQLIYGDDPSKDVVECDATQLMKHSAYLKGRMAAHDSQALRIEIDSPETFLNYIVPYIESDDSIAVVIHNIFRVIRDADLLGMRILLGDLCRYVGQNLKDLIKEKEFRLKWICKESLLEAMQYRLAHQDINMNSPKVKEFNLCVLLHWLTDSDTKECVAMNHWFGKKLSCSWLEVIQNGLWNLELIQQVQSNPEFFRFFETRETSYLLRKAVLGEQGIKCTKCELTVSRPDWDRVVCIGFSEKCPPHQGHWRGQSYNQWSCCHREQYEPFCSLSARKITLENHAFEGRN